jgi:hypothetical protein
MQSTELADLCDALAAALELNGPQLWDWEPMPQGSVHELVETIRGASRQCAKASLEPPPEVQHLEALRQLKATVDGVFESVVRPLLDRDAGALSNLRSVVTQLREDIAVFRTATHDS